MARESCFLHPIWVSAVLRDPWVFSGTVWSVDLGLFLLKRVVSGFPKVEGIWKCMECCLLFVLRFLRQKVLASHQCAKATWCCMPRKNMEQIPPLPSFQRALESEERHSVVPVSPGEEHPPPPKNVAVHQHRDHSFSRSPSQETEQGEVRDPTPRGWEQALWLPPSSSHPQLQRKCTRCISGTFKQNIWEHEAGKK